MGRTSGSSIIRRLDQSSRKKTVRRMMRRNVVLLARQWGRNATLPARRQNRRKKYLQLSWDP